MSTCSASARNKAVRSVIALAGLLLLAAPLAGLAHGLFVKARGEGRSILGTVYYSDGALAVGEYVELQDLDAPDQAAQGVQTDGNGGFRFESAVDGHRYRIVAYGEEGHQTELSLVFSEGARARLDEPDAAPADEGGLPAWLVIGGLLALSIVPARMLRKRRPA